MPRTHGFLEEAVKEIKSRPGQSANEIVLRLLEDGIAASSALNPIGSLVATLHKHHASKSVRREWKGGEYRFYPEEKLKVEKIGATQELDKSHKCNQSIGDLPTDCIDFIDALLVLPQFTNRKDVVIWLIRKGMESVEVS